MSPKQKTYAYYAKWLGINPNVFDNRGVHLVYNPLRNEPAIGYTNTHDIVTYFTPTTIVLSYGDRAAEKIPEIEKSLTLGMSLEQVKVLLTDVYSVEPSHNIKYIYKNAVSSDRPAKRLSVDDYELYLVFFKKAHPDCKDTSWVQEYFTQIAGKGYCHGVVLDGQLASATDAPDMPFMSDMVQEIGIHTLSEYRGNGYAKTVCLSCISDMMSNDICPQWSTDVSNTASQRLAARVGFEKLFDNLSICVLHS